MATRASQGNAKALFPNEDIWNLFASQAVVHSYHNYNIIYNTTEGCYYSSGETFIDILKYLIKYIKMGVVNTAGEPPQKYIKKFQEKSTLQDGKIWLIYVDGRPNYKGQNHLIRVSEVDLKNKLRSLNKPNSQLLFALINKLGLLD